MEKKRYKKPHGYAADRYGGDYVYLMWQMICPLITANQPSSLFSISRNVVAISSRSASVAKPLSRARCLKSLLVVRSAQRPHHCALR